MNLELKGFLFIVCVSVIMFFETLILGLPLGYQLYFWGIGMTSFIVFGYYWGQWWLWL